MHPSLLVKDGCSEPLSPFFDKMDEMLMEDQRRRSSTPFRKCPLPHSFAPVAAAALVLWLALLSCAVTATACVRRGCGEQLESALA